MRERGLPTRQSDVHNVERRGPRGTLGLHSVMSPRFSAVPQPTPDGAPEPGPQGTVRLFEPGLWNPIAKGAGPFYFPDGKARFNPTP